MKYSEHIKDAKQLHNETSVGGKEGVCSETQEAGAKMKSKEIGQFYPHALVVVAIVHI